MKLRSLIFLSSLVLLASCFARSKPKGPTQKPQTKVKVSMASNMNEVSIPDNHTPTHWSIEGKCRSGYDLVLNPTTLTVRLDDKCDFKLNTVTLATRIQGGGDVPREFIRHPTEKGWDHHDHPIYFKSRDGQLDFWARLVYRGYPNPNPLNPNPLSPVQPDSEIKYIITAVSEGDRHDVEQKLFAMEQLSINGVEPPRFSTERVLEQSIEHGMIKARLDLRCLGAQAFTLREPPVGTPGKVGAQAEYTAAAIALQNVGIDIMRARKRLTEATRVALILPRIPADVDTANNDARDAIAALAHAPLAAIATAVPAAYTWASSGTFVTNVTNFAAFADSVVSDEHAPRTAHAIGCAPIGGAPIPTQYSVHLRPEAAHRQLEVCLDSIGALIKVAANTGNIRRDWRCGANSLENIHYRFASDSYFGNYGRLTLADLDQIMSGVPVCNVASVNENMIADPDHSCVALRVNESADGIETVFVNPPIVPHKLHTDALLVMKAVDPANPINYSFSYFKIRWKKGH